ncbi:NAD(P)-dependent oxidoreductase [Corallincola platygyrae]|uniref:NAD(P)-dependent oxidoreductase n=1 Tax=Corallincola platygyrae TaxID=1193278 RepID=A0ABW4XQZ4_9GAMM
MAKVSFIGLGVMGFPMAGHLATSGHDVTVYNRTKIKAESWATKYKGKVADTPCDAAKDAEFIMICVGNDNDLRSIMNGPDGVLSSATPGAVIVDHTTTSAIVAREMDDACRVQGLAFLDAPVSGGQAGADNGVLTIMVGGEETTYTNAAPILESYAKSQKLMGPVGSGQLTKMVNQICIAGVVQGLAEGVHFAQQAGLDVQSVFDVISHGAAQSWQMENRVATMNNDEYNHGFAVEWMRKDLGFALEEAKRGGVSLPITALVDQFYADVENLGGKRWDTSSLLTRLQALSPKK